jgi:hypothetical protein
MEYSKRKKKADGKGIKKVKKEHVKAEKGIQRDHYINEFMKIE